MSQRYDERVHRVFRTSEDFLLLCLDAKEFQGEQEVERGEGEDEQARING